jgi:hypothetical protein
MSLVTVVLLDGAVQGTGLLRAFVGGELRGVSGPTQSAIPPVPGWAYGGKHAFAFLVHGNEDGDEVTFTYQEDGSGAQHIVAAPTTVTFEADVGVGNYQIPLELATSPAVVVVVMPPPPPPSPPTATIVFFNNTATGMVELSVHTTDPYVLHVSVGFSVDISTWSIASVVSGTSIVHGTTSLGVWAPGGGGIPTDVAIARITAPQGACILQCVDTSHRNTVVETNTNPPGLYVLQFTHNVPTP